MIDHMHVDGCCNCPLSHASLTRNLDNHWYCARLPGSTPGLRPPTPPAACPLRVDSILISLNETPND